MMKDKDGTTVRLLKDKKPGGLLPLDHCDIQVIEIEK